MRKGTPITRLIAVLAALCAPAAADGARWELGLGLAALDLPHYRGADARRGYALPFPHLIYHGERLDIDEGEVRGRLLGSARLELDLSLAGGLPVPNDGEGPRAGMPDLDPTVELGPELDIALWRGQRAAHSMWLRLPLRAAFSVGDGGVDHQGWVAAPFIEYRIEPTSPRAWRSGLALGPLFGDARYHGYFYDVAPAFATSPRPAYAAGGGYAGARATLTVRRDFGRYWVGAFARYDTLAGAAFADSPLVETRRYRALGVAVAWVLARSPGRAVED